MHLKLYHIVATHYQNNYYKVRKTRYPAKIWYSSLCSSEN